MLFGIYSYSCFTAPASRRTQKRLLLLHKGETFIWIAEFALLAYISRAFSACNMTLVMVAVRRGTSVDNRVEKW